MQAPRRWSIPAAAALAILVNACEDHPLEKAEIPDPTLDALISRLPRVGSERTGSPESERMVCHPAVDAIVDRLKEGAQLSSGQWREALLRSGAIRYRDHWPASVPFAVSLRLPFWLAGARIRLELKRECGDTTAAVIFEPGDSILPHLAATGIAAQLQVLENDEVLEEAPLITSVDDLRAEAKYLGTGSAYASVPLRSVSKDIVEARQVRARYRLRIRSSDAGLERLWEARTRWEGEITMTLEEAMRRARGK